MGTGPDITPPKALLQMVIDGLYFIKQKNPGDKASRRNRLFLSVPDVPAEQLFFKVYGILIVF